MLAQRTLGEFSQSHHVLQLGEHCFCHYYFLMPTDNKSFPVDQLIDYQLSLEGESLDLSPYYLEGQIAMRVCDSKTTKQHVAWLMSQSAS